MKDDGLDALAARRGVGSPRPAEVTERSHGFTGEVVGGEPVVVHHGKGQTGEAVSVVFGTDVAGRHRGGHQRARKVRKTDRRRRDSQVKELVEDRVQRLQFDLRALTLGHGEEVVRTELHDDKGVAQTCTGRTGVRQNSSHQKSRNSTVSIQRHDVGGVQDLHCQPLLRSVVVALHTDATVSGVFECFLKHSHRCFQLDSD